MNRCNFNPSSIELVQKVELGSTVNCPQCGEIIVVGRPHPRYQETAHWGSTEEP